MTSHITNPPVIESTPVATAVSIRATRETLDALLVIAAKRRCAVADIVAEAIEKVYGDEIRAIVSFFASSDLKSSQSTEIKDGTQS